MKPINILSLVQAYKSLDNDLFKKYLDFYGILIKNKEIDDLESFIENLNSTDSMEKLNGFYVGYTIPQVGKEFDLLRFSRCSVINIELKNQSTPEKVKKQLVKNKYYLSYLNKKIYNLTYISDENALCVLNDDEELERTTFQWLNTLLINQKLDYIYNLDKLFSPSFYLVSPFNSTEKFINSSYFLTNQQEEIKKNIIESVKNSTKYTFFSITGTAGTGKTLLVYDIVKTLKNEGKNTLVIHCGKLNNGQDILNDNGFKITPIKSLNFYNLSEYDVVVIDEAQRLTCTQLDNVFNQIQMGKGICIFSYDQNQTLAKCELNNDIENKLSAMQGINKYKLSEKIRSNKEISLFIKMLFNRQYNDPISQDNKNISINYFNTIEAGNSYLETLSNSEWELINFTTSLYTGEYIDRYSISKGKNSHTVIGQEFDNVAIVIDKYFSYNEFGKLIYTTEAYYDPERMLFQNITRVRNKLNLVVIDNQTILDRCIFILKK